MRCTVDSKPAPKTIFWRDHDGRVPVPQGGNYYVSVSNVSSIYTMSLRISKLQANDVGDYFCHAENPFGSSTTPVSVRIRNTPTLNRNVSQCCDEQSVSPACRDACTYYVDFDAIANRPECIVDFDKLMKCAADGSDHRSCCADEQVPRKCLNWCRGESVRSKEICSLQFSRTIVGCFEKNRDRLPGPPENIVVSVMSDNEVNVRYVVEERAEEGKGRCRLVSAFHFSISLHLHLSDSVSFEAIAYRISLVRSLLTKFGCLGRKRSHPFC